jgi:hypothetical protein
MKTYLARTFDAVMGLIFKEGSGFSILDLCVCVCVYVYVCVYMKCMLYYCTANLKIIDARYHDFNGFPVVN